MKKLRQRRVNKPIFDERTEKGKLNAPKGHRKLKRKRI